MAKKSQDLSLYTDEELLKKKGSYRAILSVMGVLVVMYIGFFIYLLASGTFSLDEHVPLAIFLALPVTAVPVWQNLVKVNAEIARRAGA